MPSPLRLLLVIATGVVLSWLLLCLLTWLLQRRMIYIPLTGEVPPAREMLPGAEDLVLRTEDGLELGAWLVPAAPPGPRGLVIVFNGNAGDRSFRTPLAEGFASRGFSVLLTDYRGYGGNPGRPSEAGLALDARAARAAAAAIAEPAGLPIVYLGESLGAAVALGLALEAPPAGLILRSPFASLVEVARHHYFFLPVGTLLKDRYPSIERIGRLECPVIVIAGERDGIVPPEQSRRLFEAAPEPKRLHIVEGADHNDAELLWGAGMIEASVKMLEEEAGLPARAGAAL